MVEKILYHTAEILRLIRITLDTVYLAKIQISSNLFYPKIHSTNKIASITLPINCNYANGTTAFSHCLQIIK